ncbi:unnamed protein product [Caenorhabditis angaria]|uniref:Uncharacterized protein n=1 Tax=Caenorhabditis angaria TaxID=860376 RepID=A0A9P1IVQ6_9PELO|nr:unnamed protein product [Caenorhabditis angaria]
MMSTNSVIVQKPPNTLYCSFSIYVTTCILAMFQIILTSFMAILYKKVLEGGSYIVHIVFWIHIYCIFVSTIFFVFCVYKRKIGSAYEIVLHAYLLCVLLNGLTSFFGVMYIPLFFLQTSHSFMEGVDFFVCFAASALLLGLQWAIKQVTEQMLPVMEHDFKV